MLRLQLIFACTERQVEKVKEKKGVKEEEEKSGPGGETAESKQVEKKKERKGRRQEVKLKAFQAIRYTRTYASLIHMQMHTRHYNLERLQDLSSL